MFGIMDGDLHLFQGDACPCSLDQNLYFEGVTPVIEGKPFEKGNGISPEAALGVSKGKAGLDPEPEVGKLSAEPRRKGYGAAVEVSLSDDDCERVFFDERPGTGPHRQGRAGRRHRW